MSHFYLPNDNTIPDPYRTELAEGLLTWIGEEVMLLAKSDSPKLNSICYTATLLGFSMGFVHVRNHEMELFINLSEVRSIRRCTSPTNT